MNSNMKTNKKVCKILQSILFNILLSSEFIGTVLVTHLETILVTFADKVFVIFVDTLSVTFTVSSHTITKLSLILFQHLRFSQKHVLGFQL